VLTEEVIQLSAANAISVPAGHPQGFIWKQQIVCCWTNIVSFQIHYQDKLKK
jgi:hypothetical protein